MFSSVADVYNLISAQDVRQALGANPTNAANLVQALSHHLFTLLPSNTFPSSAIVAPARVSASAEALNCLRVLGRILVVVYEAEDGSVGSVGGKTWADLHLWARQKAVKTRQEEDDERERAREAELEDQFTIGDEDEDEDGDGQDEGARAFKASIGNPAPAPQAQEDADDEGKDENGTLRDPLANPDPQEASAPPAEDEGDFVPCLADRLFSCTIDLLFCAGFTVPDSVRGEDGLGDKINVSKPTRWHR